MAGLHRVHRGLPIPGFKEEITGYGFCTNGGKSFTDLGGLADPVCHQGGGSTFSATRA